MFHLVFTAQTCVRYECGCLTRCHNSYANHVVISLTCSVQHPQHWYVDTTRAMASFIYIALPSMQRVCEDGTHVMRRIMRGIQPGHPSNRETFNKFRVNLCMRLLRVCVLPKLATLSLVSSLAFAQPTIQEFETRYTCHQYIAAFNVLKNMSCSDLQRFLSAAAARSSTSLMLMIRMPCCRLCWLQGNSAAWKRPRS